MSITKLPNQTYQTIPTRQTKPIKPNLSDKTY